MAVLRLHARGHVGSLNGDGCQSALPGPDRLDSEAPGRSRRASAATVIRQAFGPVADCERLADRVPQSRPCRHRGVVEDGVPRVQRSSQMPESRIGEGDLRSGPLRTQRRPGNCWRSERRPDRQRIDRRLRRRSAMIGLLEIVVGNAQTSPACRSFSSQIGDRTPPRSDVANPRRGRNSPL